jgi:uncharacterized repeat protein (TIGR02543 family)
VEDIKAQEGTTVKKPDADDPTRSGYTFLGWFDAAADGNDYKDDFWPHTFTGDVHNIDMYAQWEATKYNINYNNLNNGENHADNPAEYTVEDLPLPLKEPPKRDGFRFGGWYADGSFQDPAITAIPEGDTGEKTFYARWIQQFTVTIDPHDGSGPVSTTHDKGYKVPKPTDPNRGSDYKFLGWFEKETSGTKFETWPYTLTGDVEMHAQWIEIFTATFHPLGGTSDGGPTALEPKSVLKGGTVAEPGKMTKTAGGMYLGEITGVDTLTVTFLGWYDNSAYSNSPYNFATPVTTPLDLYAKWSQPVVDIPIDSKKNIIENALTYINGQTLSGPTNYTIVVEDKTTMPSASSPNINNANAVITLAGKGPAATEISFTGAESLFYITAGKLILDKNITLVGNASQMSGSPYISSVIRLTGGSLTMKDGVTIRGNTSANGGGVYVGGGEFTMEGGTISGNSATRAGGVYVNGGKFTMKAGATISGNSATNGPGGGVSVMGDGEFTMEGGTISGNSATTRGGGVYAQLENGRFNKTGGFIGGDNDTTPSSGNGNSTDNTAKGATSGNGHAVYYIKNGSSLESSRCRDATLNTGDDLSTDNFDSGWD